MAVRGIDHVAITVDDVERTVLFYQDLLGAEVVFLDRFRASDFNVVTLVIGANRINVHPSPPRASRHLVARSPTPGSADICFRVGWADQRGYSAPGESQSSTHRRFFAAPGRRRDPGHLDLHRRP